MVQVLVINSLNISATMKRSGCYLGEALGFQIYAGGPVRLKMKKEAIDSWQQDNQY